MSQIVDVLVSNVFNEMKFWASGYVLKVCMCNLEYMIHCLLRYRIIIWNSIAFIYFSYWFLGLSTLCQWVVLQATSYVLLPGIWCLCHDFKLEDFTYLSQLPFKQFMNRDFYSCSFLRYLKMYLDFVIKRNVTWFKSNLVSS